jgi:hypothetical protein
MTIAVCFEDGTKLKMHSGWDAIAAARLSYQQEHVFFEADEQAGKELRNALELKVRRDMDADPRSFFHA